MMSDKYSLSSETPISTSFSISPPTYAYGGPGPSDAPPPHFVDDDAATAKTFDLGPLSRMADSASVQDDGRFSVADLKWPAFPTEKAKDVVPTDSFETLFKPQDLSRISTIRPATFPIPHLSIVIQIVGSRGDVQPFIALSKQLQKDGHRVRIATHETFRKWVRGHNVEFFPLGGDPAELMAFMVENGGLIPSVSSIARGDVAKKRKAIAEILDTTWKSCVEPDDETHVVSLGSCF